MRPLFLFDPPQPVEVVAEVPDGPPHRFRWRRKLHEVRLFEGPERIAAEWWRRKEARRRGRAASRATITVSRTHAGAASGCSATVSTHGESPIALVHARAVRMTGASVFAELVAATNYSFLRGASHPSDMVARAIALGMSGIGIADRNTVAGVVRAWAALKQAREETGEDIDFKLAVGARLVFADYTPDIIAYPATRHGWGRLTRLLTVGNLRAEKGDCILHLVRFARACRRPAADRHGRRCGRAAHAEAGQPRRRLARGDDAARRRGCRAGSRSLQALGAEGRRAAHRRPTMRFMPSPQTRMLHDVVDLHPRGHDDPEAGRLRWPMPSAT